jgi:hypothetical protein
MIPPIDLRESSCVWRHSNEVQRCRLELEEPTRCPHQVYDCVLPPPPIASYIWETVTITDFEPSKRVRMFKKMFQWGKNENKFMAWTIDGKMPIFPIPIAEDDYE